MSNGSFKLVFKPLTGTFELERQPVPTGGEGGGTVTTGTLVLPGGVTFELNEGMAMTGMGEITLEPGSQIVVLA